MKSNELNAIIKDIALDLDVDETEQTVCPACQAKHENSFSVTRFPEGLVYNCYRAKCGIKGFISANYVSSSKTTKKVFKPKEYTGNLSYPPEYIQKYFYDKYKLTLPSLWVAGIKWDEERQRIYLPIRNKLGYDVGATSKLLTPVVGQPKSIAYWFNDTPKIHFPYKLKKTVGELFPDFVVLVEDQISSMKVSKMINCAALLGTNLSEEAALELRSMYKNVILALDPDAVNKAVALKKKYHLMFNSIKILYLPKDPKDMPYKELKTKLKEILNGT